MGLGKVSGEMNLLECANSSLHRHIVFSISLLSFHTQSLVSGAAMLRLQSINILTSRWIKLYHMIAILVFLLYQIMKSLVLFVKQRL